MDLNTALITGAGTVLCGVLVAIIFIFGFKEKTFEEALDEQRRGELLELIRGDKGRPKKQKKAGKKAKEKPLANEGKSSSEPARHAEPPVSEVTEKPTHIEFKFPEAEVVSERPPAPLPQDDNKGKKRKRDRVRPILHNKEEHSPLADEVTDSPPANHFAESQPKDDVMLKRRISREDGSSPSSEEVASEPEEPAPPLPPRQPKPDKSAKAQGTKVNGTKPGVGKGALNSETKVGKLALSTPAVPIVPVVVPAVISAPVPPPAPVAAPVIAAVVSKERKKKKGEMASLQHMISKEAEGVTMSLLLPLVRRAELSRSEVHQLIEQLLNREQGGGQEWVEGRQDPVARLKKQLADKERALAEEQQGAQAVQARLLEVRAELNGERQRQGVTLRQLEEQLSTKQHELQTLATRLQLANDTHNKSVAAAQQVQTQLAEERKKVRQLVEEKAAQQGSVAQEVEQHIQSLNQRHQEEVAMLQGQIAGIQAQVAELQGRLTEQGKSQDALLEEVASAKELSQSRERECERLQKQVKQLESQLGRQSSESEEAAAAKQAELEEALRIQTELALRVRSLEVELQRVHEEALVLTGQLETQTSPPPSPGVPDLSEKVSQLESIIQQKDALVSKLQAESQEHKTILSQLEGELEAQRTKNNDSGSEARETEQAAVRELLQRIFPAVPSSNTKDHSEWVQKFEQAAAQWLASSLSAAGEQQANSQDESTQHVLGEVEKQNSQLQAMVTHYKTIIEDTEGMLNKLERHVAQEEARWRRQLQAKEEELDTVAAERDTLLSELKQVDQQQQQQSQVEETEVALTVLQGKLQTEADQRSASEQRAQQLQQRLDELTLQVSLLEQTKEERDALALQLARESSHSQQLAQQVRELEAQRGGAPHSNHLEAKPKDQTNATTNGPSSEPSISESGSAKK